MHSLPQRPELVVPDPVGLVDLGAVVPVLGLVDLDLVDQEAPDLVDPDPDPDPDLNDLGMGAVDRLREECPAEVQK